MKAWPVEWAVLSLFLLLEVGASQASVLFNVVSPEPITALAEWQGASNGTELVVFQLDVAVRLPGAFLIPFQEHHQWLVIQAFQEVFVGKKCPATLSSYREVYPDWAAPASMRDSLPAVDLAFSVFCVPDKMTVGPGLLSWEAAGSEMVQDLVAWSSRVYELEGKWGGVDPRALFMDMQLTRYGQEGYILHPVTVLVANLSASLADNAVPMTAHQASTVGGAVEAAVLEGLGTLVEVVAYGREKPKAEHSQFVQLEVTLYNCKVNASIPTPECEQQVLRKVLGQLLKSAQVAQQLQAAGIEHLEISNIAQRQPPPRPVKPSATAAAAQPFVPWHLDRIDQHHLPLDHKFNATADGTGTHVYIVSTGILATHSEFGYLGGTGGLSRVEPEWGYMGLDSLQDCPDYDVWLGSGTYAASKCCGLQIGPAKNATIHSVRVGEICLSDPLVWSAGQLPAALDHIIENHRLPAVVYIDTWWKPVNIFGEDDEKAAMVKKALTDRLDALERADITVVAPAASVNPCENVLASHPSVISVAASDIFDQRTAFGPHGGCIDVWAPGGGLGTATLGAYPRDNNSFISVSTRSFDSAALVTGVVAQYLGLHPSATPSEVRAVLAQQLSTPAVVTGGGENVTAALLYTNLQQGAAPQFPSQQEVQPEEVPSSLLPQGNAGAASSSLSTGAIVAIVASAVGVLALIVGFVLFARRRRRRRSHSTGKLDALWRVDNSGWRIDPDEIQICKLPDGSDWLLGEGRYGKVYKAMKGVQEVAVKKLHNIDQEVQASFIQEMSMLKFVSRDANIAQFYGACATGDEMMLVVELMEGGDLCRALSADASGDLRWYSRGKGVMLDVLKGVYFLHANNVIHADIKSKNILLGLGGRAKLADVGLAQLLDGSQPAQSEVHFVGTLPWAAPETLEGAPLTTKADIYSLGVLLWEVVTHEAPCRGFMRDPVVPEECPEEVAAAIQACMQHDPALRPTAKDLHAQLLACPPADSHSSVSSPRLAPLKTNVRDGSGSELRKEVCISIASEGTNSSTEGRQRTVDSCSTGTQLPSTNLGQPMMSAELSMATIDFSKLEFCKNSDGSLQRLGEGAFGSVYKVLLDGVQLLAAKSIDLGHDPADQSAFLQEAGLLWRLRHRNITTLTGVSVSEDGKGFLLMEYMEGGSLHSLLGKLGKDGKKRVLSWYGRGRQVIIDVARGIHYLHSMRTTHMDIKSANVLLSKDWNAKLADVGLARVLSHTHISLSHKKSVGTFTYMAPELMAGTKCTSAVDIYSFGILLWEVCSGEHATRGRLWELRVPEDCPQEVADLFNQCISIDPAARPTAKEIVRRLLEQRYREQGGGSAGAKGGRCAVKQNGGAAGEAAAYPPAQQQQQQQQQQQASKEQQPETPPVNHRRPSIELDVVLAREWPLERLASPFAARQELEVCTPAVHSKPSTPFSGGAAPGSP